MIELSFSIEVFRRFPGWFFLSMSLLVIQGIFASLSILSIAPIVDLFLHPDLQGASPLTLRLIDIFQSYGIPTNLMAFGSIFLTTILLKNLFFIVVRYILLVIKYLILRALTNETLGSIFQARWLLFTNASKGTFLNTFLYEINRVGDAVGQLGMVLATGSQILIFMVVPLAVAWKTTLICLMIAAVFAIPLLITGKWNYYLGRENTRTANELSATMKDNLEAAKVILGFGEGEKGVKWYLRAFDAHRNVTIKSQTLNLGIPLFYEPLGILALFSTLYSSRFISIPISEIALVIWGLRGILGQIGSFVSYLNMFRGFLPSYEQVNRLKEEAIRWRAPSGELEFKELHQSIDIQQVSFTYPGRKVALEHINLKIPRGKMIAVVGSSGSGKSTLIDLLLGLNVPDQGQILVDDIPLQQYALDTFRKRVGYVPQDAVLFNMSIRDNLLWANVEATEKELWQACVQANAMEFVEKLPAQFDTVIGDRGIRLSGGQCQRLALARALVRNPELLVLDEATSALDTHSEQLIQQAIDEISGGITIVLVAHRLSTITNADYVYVMQNGNVAEEGKYTELMERKGLFFKMVKAQQLHATT